MTHRAGSLGDRVRRFRTLWCMSADLERTLSREVRDNEVVLAIVPGGVLKPDHLQVALERTDYRKALLDSSFSGDR